MFVLNRHWYYVLRERLYAIFKLSVHSLPILFWAFQTSTLIVGQRSCAVDFLTYKSITQMHTDIYSVYTGTFVEMFVKRRRMKIMLLFTVSTPD